MFRFPKYKPHKSLYKYDIMGSSFIQIIYGSHISV